MVKIDKANACTGDFGAAVVLSPLPLRRHNVAAG